MLGELAERLNGRLGDIGGGGPAQVGDQPWSKTPSLVSYTVYQLGEHPCGHGGSERVWRWRRRRTSTKSPHSGGGTQLSDKVKRLEMEKRFSLLFCQIKRQRGVLAFTAWVVRTGGSLQLAPSTSYLDVLEFFAYYLSLLSFLYVISSLPCLGIFEL